MATNNGQLKENAEPFFIGVGNRPQFAADPASANQERGPRSRGLLARALRNAGYDASAPSVSARRNFATPVDDVVDAAQQSDCGGRRCREVEHES